jgi:hypothetical protein
MVAVCLADAQSYLQLRNHLGAAPKPRHATIGSLGSGGVPPPAAPRNRASRFVRVLRITWSVPPGVSGRAFLGRARARLLDDVLVRVLAH